MNPKVHDFENKNIPTYQKSEGQSKIADHPFNGDERKIEEDLAPFKNTRTVSWD